MSAAPTNPGGRKVWSELEVADPSLWDELAAVIPLEAHTAEILSPTRRVATAAFDKDGIAALRRAGVNVLVRYAARPRGEVDADAGVVERVAALTPRARAVLHAAQRHAVGAWVVAHAAWDPEMDLPAIRELLGLGLAELPFEGDGARLHLHPELPPPPAVDYDLHEAVMDAPSDLGEAKPGPVSLLHDLASLSAVVDIVRPKRTFAGPLAVADGRRLAARLGVTFADGRIEGDPRWGRALRGLEALGVVASDTVSRELALDRGLEDVLAGTTEEAVDRMIHRLVDPDLHTALPSVRSALRQAGDGAIDEVVFVDLVFEQHRDVLFTPWRRSGRTGTYPGEEGRPFDREGFDVIEVPMFHRLLKRLERLGVVRLGEGVFAGTVDGKRWAMASTSPMPPMWVSSDLELVVPPDAITPWERLQIERLGRNLGRDTVDRYRLDRDALGDWLKYHDLAEAEALLVRRCPHVPAAAFEVLRDWARAATRVVLTRGIRADAGHGT